MQKVWNIKDVSQTKKSVIERLLDIRGFKSEKKREDFLNPLKMNFTSPYVFSDMEKCVQRICNAIENKEKIVVWGDFDADGVTSTCTLYKTLKHLGADVDYYIPSRQSENHGLNSQGLIKFISKKTKLFITVDCGSSNEKEIKLAKSFKADVIVTDHHEVPKHIEELYGIINPKAENNLDENLSVEQIEYLTDLAGVGVAFKLSLALLEKYDKKDFSNELLPLVTLGTIADIVPLIGENRAFVKMGLELIKQGKNKGITTLLKSINYNYEINSDCVAFYIAPRINASGRVDTAQLAFNLLYEENEVKLSEYAKELNDYNLERQELCDQIYEEAIKMIQNDKDFSKNPAIVLYNPQWHIGVIGIVASKLVETFYKPTFLMCDKEGLVSCSSRGIEQTNIYEIIDSLSELTENGGGHKMAGGFAFDPKKTTFDEIKAKINETTTEMVGETELTPHLNIDLNLNLDETDINILEDLKVLEPFGTSNPQPLFCSQNLELVSAKLMGQNSNHLKLQVKDSSSKIFDCVFWNKDVIPKPENNRMDVAYYLKKNEFNGEVKLQLDLKDMQYEQASKVKIIDQRKKEDVLKMLENYTKDNAENIKIYAYKNDTLEKLSAYPNLSQNILTKAQQTAQLVFLDYPKSLDNLKIIIDKTKPQIIHLTRNKMQFFGIDEFFKTLSGLLKYVFTKKEGKLNIKDLSNYFTYNEVLIKESINLLEKAQIVEIKDDTILNINPTELSNLKKQTSYKEIENQLDINNKFLNKLTNAAVSDIEALLES